MNAQEQLTELEALAGKLDVQICYESMSGLVQGIGGLCRVKGQYRIIIDKRLKPPERIQIVADALRKFEFSTDELSPQIRKLLV